MRAFGGDTRIRVRPRPAMSKTELLQETRRLDREAQTMEASRNFREQQLSAALDKAQAKAKRARRNLLLLLLVALTGLVVALVRGGAK